MGGKVEKEAGERMRVEAVRSIKPKQPRLQIYELAQNRYTH